MYKGLGRVFGAVLLILICTESSPGAVGGGQGGLNLAWTASPDTNVIGYYVYYGPGIGSYTQRVDVGSATSTTVSGLTPGSTNYFAATAYDDQGSESDPSNEIVFIQPGTIRSEFDASNNLHLIFPVAAGHSYDIQFSTALPNWTTLTTIFSATNGIYDYIDTNFTGALQRFYRLILH